MKKRLIIPAMLIFMMVFSMPSKAGAPENNPKYAIINVFFRGMAPGKIFVIVDGKVESIKCESGFMDQEAGELSIFGVVQAQLEKLGEVGYKLKSTAALSPSLLSYTLVKE